ncbi:Phage-related protein [Mycobacteroides abscessus subsp. abscessus]|nr:Phage-related protein [Mycobacteroides abscessus subsp. abscessus]SIG63561.1 Phage-related protein [Mycobacteroides abscessus subsp. abscessus]
MGTSLDDLRDFPADARQDAGYQLEQVQFGLDPDDWEPMPDVGAGTREIRVKTEDGIFRVFYVTKFGDKVYVLHSFTKKTQKTPKRDIDRGARMYKDAKRIYEEKRREGDRR